MQRIQTILAFLLLFFSLLKSIGQTQQMNLTVELEPETRSLHIKQKITYYNPSKDTLSAIYFHDWPNAYSDKNTDLGKRFIENYKRRFFFTKEKYRGHTSIKNIVINHISVPYKRVKETDDFFNVPLNKPLLPKDSTSIQINYIVKIPSAKFTNYGVYKNTYNLRFWYITPAVYSDHWHLMHNLNMDDLFETKSDFTIQLKIPKTYTLNSNIVIQKTADSSYLLIGKNRKDIELILETNNSFQEIKTEKHRVITNLNTIELTPGIKSSLLNRQLQFLEEKIGSLDHSKILINKIAYTKDPLYGFNQLPNFLRPFSDTFEWDLRMFKTLTKEYVSSLTQTDTRENTWLTNGVQSYLLMQYVQEYYKEMKLIGSASKIWGIRSYYFSKLDFNSRYHLTYQHFARKNRDQSLYTRTDSLTNFNRLVLNKYKAALGLQYLDDYLGDNTVQDAIKYAFENSTISAEDDFRNYILSHTKKDVTWFFNDFLITDNKVDYSIQRIHRQGDSLHLKINNKKHNTWPIALYSLKKDSILSKKWLLGIQDTKIIDVNKGESTRWVLNYEQKIPETNIRNNWKNSNKSLINRPLSFKWLNDADDPEHTQLFFEPKFDYNYYDGFMVASGFTNRNLLKKEFEYTLIPSYGFKNHSFTGSFKTIYWHYPKSELISSYRMGLVGAYYHYKPKLSYKVLRPYAQIFFKRKNLRSVKSRSISASYIMVDREVDPLETSLSEANKYNVFYLKYIYSNPELINNFLFLSGLELGNNFTKVSVDVRFRKLTNSRRQFEARFFTGVFLSNNTTSDFFSYGINRPNDYLFRYHYYGRSETTGIFSQQFIVTDASFKSKIPVSYANQWVTSFNTSIGLWRWFELYNDVGFAKNKNQSVYFIHDKGVRLNFVHNIFEVYFPVHSNNGWEIAQPHYENRIRFTLTSDIHQIIAFLKRGFM